MSEILQEVDEIAKTIPEVAPPGWGHTVAKKEKTKPNKPKSKVGGSAHEFQKDLDSGKFKGLPGDKTAKDKKASMFKIMWAAKNKGDKPHYKPGVKDKLKSQYKEEVEMDEWGDTSILSKQSARIAGRPDIGSMDNKPHRKLKITPDGLDALRKDRDRPKVKTQVKITKKGRDAIKDEVETEGFFSGKTKGRVAKSFLDDPMVRKITGRKSLADIAKKKKEQQEESAYQVKTAAHKRGRISVKDFNSPEDAKKHLEKMRKKGHQGLVSQAGKPVKEGRYASAASDPRIGGSSSVDTVPDFAIKAKKGAMSAPGSGSIAKAKKAKASDVNKSIEQQMADAMKESSSKWAQNFKANARKRLGATKQRQSENPPSARDDVKDLLDPHREYKAKKRSLRSEEIINELAQWKVKLKGLPSFYVPGKSAGQIRQMLRKQLKRPMDDIEDITRETPASMKKDFRSRAQGQPK